MCNMYTCALRIHVYAHLICVHIPILVMVAICILKKYIVDQKFGYTFEMTADFKILFNNDVCISKQLSIIN